MSAGGALMVVAVPAALAGSAAMGLANVTQSTATHQVPAGGIIDPHLLWNLARNPTWLIGIGATVAGLGLQLVALGFGPLLLVQPLLVTALLFTTLFTAWLRHCRLDRITFSGATLCVAGLCAFLVIARPEQATGQIAGGLAPLPLAATFGVLVGVCLAVAYRTQHVARVLALALATGVIYGVTAGLMKLLAAQFRAGLAVPFTQWALYTACLLGPLGFWLSQSTFQHGAMAAPAVAVITTVDPLVGIGIGVSWYGETLSTSPAALAGETIAAAAIIAGIVILSHRTEHLKHHAPDPRAGRPIASSGDLPA